MLRTAIAASLLALVVACEKPRRKVPPADTSSKPALSPDKPAWQAPRAPAEVPSGLRDRISQEWPEIEAAGKLFMAKVKEAGAARESGDRDKLDVIIHEANKQFTIAMDSWNEIYYSVDDESDEVMEAARKYMSRWNKKVDRWMQANKSLKEFSRVK